jgi:uncharacterized RDD family membrane protein YckC
MPRFYAEEVLAAPVCLLTGQAPTTSVRLTRHRLLDVFPLPGMTFLSLELAVSAEGHRLYDRSVSTMWVVPNALAPRFMKLPIPIPKLPTLLMVVLWAFVIYLTPIWILADLVLGRRVLGRGLVRIDDAAGSELSIPDGDLVRLPWRPAADGALRPIGKADEHPWTPAYTHQRVTAYMIDAVVWCLLSVVLVVPLALIGAEEPAGQTILGVGMFVILIGYRAIGSARDLSVGKRMVHLSVRNEQGDAPTLGQTVVREFLWLVSVVMAPLLLLAFRRPEHRCLHERLSGTRLYKT